MPSFQSINANSSGYTTEVVENDGSGLMRQNLLVGTAATGQVRVEWVQARYGQVIPCNWSWVQMWQYMNAYVPLRYQVDDAQNLIAAAAVAGDYEWLLLYEHDVLPPPDALIRLAEYMKNPTVPIVSGLYFTRGHPSEPLIYRGRGTLAYEDFEIGDLVWADGVPTGFLLIHMSIIRAMWDESEEYMIGEHTVRRIFETPNKAWFDPESGQYNTINGTSDLAWCTRVQTESFFGKAGWPEYDNSEFPFLVDTNIACGHINPDGEQFPPGGIQAFWQAKKQLAPIKPPDVETTQEQPPTLGVSVSDGIGVGERMGA